MYKDFEGTIIIDTVDHFPTLERYAENYKIDTNKYHILEIKFYASRNSLNIENIFICKDKLTDEIIEIPFTPTKDIFSQLIKRSEIRIKNSK